MPKPYIIKVARPHPICFCAAIEPTKKKKKKLIFAVSCDSARAVWRNGTVLCVIFNFSFCRHIPRRPVLHLALNFPVVQLGAIRCWRRAAPADVPLRSDGPKQQRCKCAERFAGMSLINARCVRDNVRFFFSL